MSIRACFVLRLRVSVAAALLLAGLAAPAAAAPGRLAVTSGAFTDGAKIPPVYAFHGCAPSAANRSPALAWRGAPPGTKSYALTMFDPDAPTGHGFWHWVMFDIPPSVHRLAPGMGEMRAAPAGAILGHIDFGISAYGGPCPPPGDKPHHYIVIVRALDVATLHGANAATTGPELVALMTGHVLAQGTIVGRFAR